MVNNIELIKEARKAGMQAAGMMFGALLVVSILFGVFIYESFNLNKNTIEAVQTNELGDNTVNQGIE